jgi:hypothetical protein
MTPLGRYILSLELAPRWYICGALVKPGLFFFLKQFGTRGRLGACPLWDPLLEGSPPKKVHVSDIADFFELFVCACPFPGVPKSVGACTLPGPRVAYLHPVVCLAYILINPVKSFVL